MRKELTPADMELIRLPRRYWTATIQGVVGDADFPGGRAKLMDVIQAYGLAIPDRFKDGVGMVLSGANGVGKTCALSVILMEARRQGFSSGYLDSSELKDATFQKRMHGNKLLVDWARGVDFLLIDDFAKGAGDSAGIFAELLNDLIRHRGGAVLPTLISTNVPIASFVESGIKRSTASFLKETCALFVVSGKDQRDAMVTSLARRVLG